MDDINFYGGNSNLKVYFYTNIVKSNRTELEQQNNIFGQLLIKKKIKIIKENGT